MEFRKINDNPVCKTAKETQMYRMDFWTVGEGESGMISENGIETCKISCKKQITSLCPIQDTGCLGLLHGDDPERLYGVGGGRRVQDWELMYTRG